MYIHVCKYVCSVREGLEADKNVESVAKREETALAVPLVCTVCTVCTAINYGNHRPGIESGTLRNTAVM
jgi:hypothetical protein